MKQTQSPHRAHEPTHSPRQTLIGALLTTLLVPLVIVAVSAPAVAVAAVAVAVFARPAVRVARRRLATALVQEPCEGPDCPQADPLD